MKFKTPKKNRIKTRSKNEKVVFAIASGVLFLFALTYVLVFLWGIYAGLRTHNDLILDPFGWPKNGFHPENYIDAFKMLEVNGTNMIGMIGNSLWLVAGGSILNVAGATFMAYAVTKYNFVGRKLLININIITMTLPIIGSLPAQYNLYSKFGFINSPTILIPYFGAFGSINLFMCAFFRGVSPTYSEAAKIDGANDYVIMFRIVLPLAKGIISALIILQAVGIWNDYNTALVFMPKLPTLATGIYLFNTQMVFKARMDILFAATVLSAIPPLVLYAIGHKSILSNISYGGIKG